MKTHTMTALAAGAIGYVLGTRAGRDRYEQIRQNVRKVAEDPRLKDVAHRAEEKAKEKAPGVAERLTAAADKVRPQQGAHAGSTTDTTWPEDEGRFDRTSPSSATHPLPGG